MQLQRIEEASLNAWPALHQMLYDGWIMRFAKGYTKRANSVTPLYQGAGDLASKVAFSEQIYADSHLPLIFRLPSFCLPAGLDELLETRGYSVLDETLVYARGLETLEWSAPLEMRLQTMALGEWLPIYSRMSGSTENQQEVHRAILEAIRTQRTQFALCVQGSAVACGLGVLEDGYFGLFDIVTAPTWRRRGYGTQLVGGMLDWARRQGGLYAYLQVVGTNTPALRVYRAHGFSEAYRYWYRTAPLAS